MNRRIVNSLFHAACVFCLLSVFQQTCFLLYNRDDTRGLHSPVFKIITVNEAYNPSYLPDPKKAATLLNMIHEKSTQSDLVVLFLPDNTIGDQIEVYIAGRPEAFSSSIMRSGRFFNTEELLGKSNVLIAYADSWLDVFFFRENRRIYDAAGDREVIGVLEPDDVLQRDGYFALAPLGKNNTFAGTWYISSDDPSFITMFESSLRNMDLPVNTTCIKPLGINPEGIKILLSEKTFVIFLFGLLASLVNLFFYYNQYLQREKRWNRIRYMVGARKSTHYLYAISSLLGSAIPGVLLGGLLPFFYFFLVLNSSITLRNSLIWFPALLGVAILFFGVIFSILYMRTDFVEKRREME